MLSIKILGLSGWVMCLLTGISLKQMAFLSRMGKTLVCPSSHNGASFDGHALLCPSYNLLSIEDIENELGGEL